MSNPIHDLDAGVRRSIADWIGERPETIIAVATLGSGNGRIWLDGDTATPAAVLIESTLVPGEPQGFGDAAPLIRLLEQANGWSCVEVDSRLADAIGDDFEQRWGIAQIVEDVIHALGEPCAEYSHPLVRQLTAAETLELPTTAEGVLPDRRLVATAAEHGRFFAAVEHGIIIGHGGALAAGSLFADVGVLLANNHRRNGIAAACASSVCKVLQAEGLVPVWGTSSDNVASLTVARKLGFVEVARLRYLVRKS